MVVFGLEMSLIIMTIFFCLSDTTTGNVDRRVPFLPEHYTGLLFSTSVLLICLSLSRFVQLVAISYQCYFFNIDRIRRSCYQKLFLIDCYKDPFQPVSNRKRA